MTEDRVLVMGFASREQRVNAERGLHPIGVALLTPVYAYQRCGSCVWRSRVDGSSVCMAFGPEEAQIVRGGWPACDLYGAKKRPF